MVTRPRKTRHVTPAPAAAAAGPWRGALWVLATPRGWAGAASRSAELVLVARFYSGRGAGGAGLLLACVECCQGPSPVRRGRCLRQHCTAWHRVQQWPHLTSPATSDHQPRPGKPRKLVLSPTAGVRRETSYGETAGRAAAPCSVSSVHSPRHTGPSRAAASESPSPPQQHGTGSRDKGRLPQLDTVVTECQHSVLTPDTD